tara:strand:- start:88882 stop:89724 length:843 start_codon:yes stop_codon:yes gene_type:complete
MDYCAPGQEDQRECLDALIKEINEELTIACQIPFTVPKKEIARIVVKAKKYFYKIYEDSIEEMYIALPKSSFSKSTFKEGINTAAEQLTVTNLNSTRGIIKMPNRVFSVYNVFEMTRFSGEDGGFGTRGFSSGDSDFSIDKFIYSDSYGAGLGSENLMYYVVNELFLDSARQVLQQQISYKYNRLTHNFRFMGELPTNSVVFHVGVKILDCDLFQDEMFLRYCVAQAKISLSRILGTFNYNLPGNITLNYDLIRSEGQEDVAAIVEEIKSDEGTDYFFTG